MKKLILVLIITIGLVGCASKEETGAIAGAGVGAAAGSMIGNGSTAGALIGGALGAFAGSRIGKWMEEQDEQKTAQALETTKTNQTSQWVNPDTGNKFAVTPTETYQSAAGQPCREFIMSADSNGGEETTRKTACRNDQGQWVIQSKQVAE